MNIHNAACNTQTKLILIIIINQTNFIVYSYLCKVLADVSQGTVCQTGGPQASGPVVQADTVGGVHMGLHVVLTQPIAVIIGW